MSLTTHAAKLIHGDSRISNILDKQTVPAPAPVVSSLLLAGDSVDIVGNSAAIDLARLLMMSAGQGSLGLQLSDGDYSALEPLATGRRRDEDCGRSGQWRG